jgi:lysophospholipase L1-like esterase
MTASHSDSNCFRAGGVPPAATGAPRRQLSGRRRCLFIGIILSVFFVAQELILRFVFPVPEVLFNRADYIEPQFKPSKAISNVIFRWECEPDGQFFDHTLNIYGFRGPNFVIAPPIDRPRILFIGDSFVEGCGASDDDTLPQQFARLLTDAPVPEVLNLGISASGFTEYLQLMRDAVPLLRPSTVFVVACFNDLPTLDYEGAVPPPGGLESLPQRTFAAVPPYMPRAVQAVTLLSQGWTLPRRGHRGPFPFLAPVPSPTNPFSEAPQIEGLDEDVEEAMRAAKCNPFLAGSLPTFEQRLRHNFEESGGAANVLRFMAWFCREHGVRLNVVYIPFHMTANPVYLSAQLKLGGCAKMKLPASFSDDAHRRQQQHLAKACRDADIPFMDLTDAMIAAERERRLYWPIDGHCNAHGYRVIAEACVRRWTESSPGSSRP